MGLLLGCGGGKAAWCAMRRPSGKNFHATKVPAKGRPRKAKIH